jgi:hypothetical protein
MMTLKSLIKPLAVILAFEITFIVCFFTGVFWNPPIRIEIFDPLHRYYINRGYPKSWAGVSRADKIVPIPFVKLPYTGTWMDGVLWVKIIDLRIFVVLFAAVFIVAYFFAYQIVKYDGRLKFMKTLQHLLVLALLFICIVVYTQWFPRI